MDSFPMNRYTQFLDSWLEKCGVFKISLKLWACSQTQPLQQTLLKIAQREKALLLHNS
jgi:hypothetical protein